MEDVYSIGFQERTRSKEDDINEDNERPNYVYFGVFDGHGGKEAAIYTKDNLLTNIVSNRKFWSLNDNEILEAIKEGFIATHYAMSKEVGK